MNKVTIVLTTYNVDKYIEECLDSILNQTISNYELIILDDGSTDETINIIKSKYKDLRLIENDHLGVAKERNLGASLVNTPYVCFLDTDDYFEKDMLEKLVNSIEENNSDLVLSGAYKFDDKTRDEVELKYMLNRNITLDKSYIETKMINNIFQLTVANAWAKLFKTEIIKKYNLKFQDLKNSNDVLFVYSYMVNTNRISFVYEPLVHYRFNNSSSIQGTKKNFPFEFLKAYESLQEYLINNDYYNMYKDSFINMIIGIIIWNMDTTNNDEIKDKINEKYYDYFKIDEVNIKDDNYNKLIEMLGR